MDGALGTKPLSAGGYRDLGAKPPAAGRFLYVFGKKAILIPLDHISHVFERKPFERTRFLTLQSQLKNFNCLILLLVAIKFQNTFKILHYDVKF